MKILQSNVYDVTMKKVTMSRSVACGRRFVSQYFICSFSSCWFPEALFFTSIVFTLCSVSAAVRTPSNSLMNHALDHVAIKHGAVQQQRA